MQEDLTTTCCVVGGGPAGMMLGLLLAKAGVQVTVIEKHKDFFRDFRGDTLHPSTLEIINQLGSLAQLLKLPHQKAFKLRGYFNDTPITIADFSKLKVACPYIMLIPQWDFLNFIAAEAKQYKNFNILMQTEAIDLIKTDGKVSGVIAQHNQQQIKIYSTLVVAADGRHSILRQKAGLQVNDLGAPMDVFWFRISRKETDPNETFGKFITGHIIAMINRQEYWQCGYVIPKGQAEQFKTQDIENFRTKVAASMNFLQDRVAELKSWDDVKLLSVRVDRLTQWYLPGLLCIGDAAHAMSPVGGVGINLAIQDAVATANIIAQPLKQNILTTKNLAAVQRRRMPAVKIIQAIQLMVQKRVISSVLSNKPLKMPWLARFLLARSITQKLLGRIIGIGVHAEQIK